MTLNGINTTTGRQIGNKCLVLKGFLECSKWNICISVHTNRNLFCIFHKKLIQWFLGLVTIRVSRATARTRICIKVIKHRAPSISSILCILSSLVSPFNKSTGSEGVKHGVFAYLSNKLIAFTFKT